MGTIQRGVENKKFKDNIWPRPDWTSNSSVSMFSKGYLTLASIGPNKFTPHCTDLDT